jgi:hypothetical protein
MRAMKGLGTNDPGISCQKSMVFIDNLSAGRRRMKAKVGMKSKKVGNFYKRKTRK